MIWFTCPECQVKFSIRESDVDRPVECPRCRNSVHVPASAADADALVVEAADDDEPLDAELVEEPRSRPAKPRRRPPPPSREPAVDAAFPNGLPPKVAALGPFLFSISVQSWARPFFHIMGIVLMVLALLMIVPGLICLIPPVQTYLKELAALFIVGMMPAFMMLVFGLVLFLATRVANDWSVLFFDDGFVVVYPKRHLVWRWRDLRGLYTERIDKRTYMYGFEVSRQMISNFTVEHVNGARFLFRNGCPRNNEIGELLQQKTLEWQLPLARTMLERGEDVEFRPFVVTDEGIERGRAFASWDDIDDVDVNNGTIYVRARGRNVFSAKASQVANVVVFLVLAEDVLEGRLKI